jgi:broad specificity phosphatase PhoE
MSILYLIRHAQASFGRKNYDRLSTTGLEQARISAGHLNDLNLEFNAIYSGTQVRHEQTLAAYLEKVTRPDAAAPPVHKTDAFNEYDSENILKTLIPEMIRQEPAFEADVLHMMEDRRAFQNVYEKIMRQWMRRRHPIQHLETWETYSRRVTDGLFRITAAHGSGSKVAVFTSGGPIAVCVQKALDLSDEKTLELTWQIMNASITRLKYSGDRIMLSGFNNVTHLELKKDARLLTYR